MKLNSVIYLLALSLFIGTGAYLKNIYDEKVELETSYSNLKDNHEALGVVLADNEKEIRKYKEDVQASNALVAEYQQKIAQLNQDLALIKKKKLKEEKDVDVYIDRYRQDNPGVPTEDVDRLSVEMKSTVRIEALWSNYCAANVCEGQ